MDYNNSKIIAVHEDQCGDELREQLEQEEVIYYDIHHGTAGKMKINSEDDFYTLFRERTALLLPEHLYDMKLTYENSEYKYK